MPYLRIRSIEHPQSAVPKRSPNLMGLLLVVSLVLGACTQAPIKNNAGWTYQPPSDLPIPGVATTPVMSALGKKIMVAAPHPLASDAGFQILKAGGTAVDAAIAVQMVMTVVEPQSSGIGGGAFLLHADGSKLAVYDGRETAPAAATERLFMQANNEPMPYWDGLVGGRSVGVPGVLRMLQAAHQAHGKLPWAKLFQPAIRLAETGYPVSPLLAAYLAKDEFLKRDPDAAELFYDQDGRPKTAGSYIRNLELAKVLRLIAKNGADVFYTGSLAKDIVDKVKKHPTNPGLLSESDMAGYEAILREPVCSEYRQWRVCGVPPPSSGGLAVAQILGILQAKLSDAQMAALKPQRTENEDGTLGKWQVNEGAIHWLAEAGRLAYADRNAYVADTDYVPLPGGSTHSLLDPAYLAQRASLLGEKDLGRAKPGQPKGAQVSQTSVVNPERPATAHFSIVDGYGHAVSMTTTIEDTFGSRIMVHGFLLNNELTDFSYTPDENGQPVANRVQPGKRPRSSMAPTLVFDKLTGQLVLSVGSPGGPLIINYVAKTLVAALDWGLNIQEAIELPYFGSRNGFTELEHGQFDATILEALQVRGHHIDEVEWRSGVQGIMRTEVDGELFWMGGADPRREGMAKGE